MLADAPRGMRWRQVEWMEDPTKKRKLPVLKLFLPATITLLATLATLTACSDTTPALEEVPTPTQVPTKVAAPASTDAPVSTEASTERPTAAPRATPASPPTPEPTATPAPLGVLAPLQALDSSALLSELSDTELACIGNNPEKLARSLAGPGSTPREDQAKLIGCLEDETLARIFLAGFVPDPEPLSQETSDCVRAGFAVIDPRTVMTAGIEGDPGRAMAGSMTALSVTVACLTDQEWEETAPMLGMSLDERKGMQCLLAELGGPGPMAAAMTAAQEGHFTILAQAGAECGLDMGPVPRQPPGTPPPAPTQATTAPTPASTPVITGATLTGTPATPTPSPTRMPAPATPTPDPTPTNTPSTSTPIPSTLVITVAEIPVGIPDYSRSEWKHWTDEDGDCQDARQEVLIAESLETVTYETDRECRVETGQWWAPHLGHHLGNPSHLDVDHHVPLKNAHLSGAWAWSPEMKEEYANYLDDPDHLVALSSRHNRSKGARGPQEWAPPDNALWCDYATDWAEIKARWDLTMTPVESAIVMDMLGTCENPPAVELEATGNVMIVPGVDKPTADPEDTVYGSCEEAAEAGEERVQGSRGGGKGFSAETVPSVRDGDGDGVVVRDLMHNAERETACFRNFLLIYSLIWRTNHFAPNAG